MDHRASEGCDIFARCISTVSWTPYLLESIYTCGSRISNLQVVQGLHIFRCEFEVKDIGIGLNPICGLGGGNGDQTTESAFR